jgi:uncharacterized protein YuzE
MDKISRHIDIWKYDFETDILFFRDKSLEYHSSIDMGDLIIDMGVDGIPIGVELLNASKNFTVPKVLLRDIDSLKAEINISKTDIEVIIKVFVIIRNTRVEKISVSYGVNDINLQAGQTAMIC